LCFYIAAIVAQCYEARYIAIAISHYRWQRAAQRSCSGNSLILQCSVGNRYRHSNVGDWLLRCFDPFTATLHGGPKSGTPVL